MRRYLGVGVIHRAAGPELLAACQKIGGCPTGEARITPGFRLPARWVVHTVGPVWHGGTRGEEGQLASCYRESVALAAEHGARTMAFPSISTGAFGYPVERAAPVVIGALREALAAHPEVERITMVCRGNETFDAFRRGIGEA